MATCAAAYSIYPQAQELNSRALHQFRVADRLRHALPFAVGLPVRPGAARGGVVDQLVEVGGHLHAMGPYALALPCEYRPRDHEHIARGAQYIGPRIVLDLGPGPTVVLDVLRHHVGQREALRHGRRRGHVAGWRHVPA